MYFIILILGFCVSYFLVGRFFALFFQTNINYRRDQKNIFRSLAILIVGSILVYFWSESFQNIEIGNRILHGVGGGVMAFLMCFLSALDHRVQMTKTQFFILSALIVTALGVVNEVVEFALQYYFDIQTAPHIYDTWFDLISNSSGLLMAGAVFTPFVSQLNEKERS